MLVLSALLSFIGAWVFYVLFTLHRHLQELHKQPRTKRHVDLQKREMRCSKLTLVPKHGNPG
jgi:hypothetical protein